MDGGVEDAVIETFLLEEDRSDQAEDVFFVYDEGVVEHFPLSEHVQVVVIENGLPNYHHKLVDRVHELSHLPCRDLWVVIRVADEIDEFAFEVVEHAVRLVEVLLNYHRELEENLEVTGHLPRYFPLSAHH